MKELLIQPEHCLGCRSCELACAVTHSNSKNLLLSLSEISARNTWFRLPATGKLLSPYSAATVKMQAV